MHTLGVGNVADHSARIHIEHFHLRAMRDIQTASGFVDRQIVKTALARDRNFLRHAVAANRRSSCAHQEERHQEGYEQTKSGAGKRSPRNDGHGISYWSRSVS